MTKFSDKSEQRGTLLVEALAMLGLIAMVTPTLYKKIRGTPAGNSGH